VQKLLIGLLGAFIAAARLVAATNPAPTAASQAIDPVEKEFKRLMAADDDAQAEVDQWILDNEAAAARGAALSKADLQHRIMKRFAPIRQAYEEFLRRHPDYAPGYVAYGSFLHDLHDSDGARAQWEKALALNPKDPAAYNNLANLYSHSGEIKKAFEYYAKASELNPREPIYYQNLGDAVFVFRKDAREHYGLSEQQVFNKALDLYRQALKLDPTNFPLASEVAQTYYGIKPLRLEEALTAWTNALALAHDEIEREGVYVHFARLKYLGDRFAEARAHLNAVTNEMYAVLKGRLVRNLDKAEREAQGTNAAPAAEHSKPK
jgi:tetratricopeptide (TPR) repeat protein